MTTEQAVLIMSVVVIAANGIGALINNKRYWQLQLAMERLIAALDRRVAVMEAQQREDRLR